MKLSIVNGALGGGKMDNKISFMEEDALSMEDKFKIFNNKRRVPSSPIPIFEVKIKVNSRTLAKNKPMENGVKDSIKA